MDEILWLDSFFNNALPDGYPKEIWVNPSSYQRLKNHTFIHDMGQYLVYKKGGKIKQFNG